MPGETAIRRVGTRVIVNRSPKFGRDLPRLLDVPQFEGVLIHRGNSAEDSAGCILVGENKVKGKLSIPHLMKSGWWRCARRLWPGVKLSK